MMKYMDGLLDDFEQMNLDKHIEACEACREDFAIYQEMMTGFDHNNEEIIEAPEGFVACVMEKLDDINIYFPKKVRDRGKMLDSAIFIIWGLMAAAFAIGTALFLHGEAIFGWLQANGLAAVAASMQPFADFAAGFGMTLEYYTQTASGWLGSNTSDFAIVFLLTFVALVGVQFYMSPKYAEINAEIKRKRRKII
jgi:anti-sigma factor RsiW